LEKRGWIIIACRAWRLRRRKPFSFLARLQGETEQEIEANIADGAYEEKQATLF
jgi:hypothetical protein